MTDIIKKPITHQDDLIAFVEALSKSDYITVDTEFLRDSTYWPKLCLIQAANHDIAGVIDPLSKDIDLTPFHDLMQNQSILKVFHAARQDLEIFFHAMNETMVCPIFDSQIAAMVCGFGDSISYEKLVKQIVDVNIDKVSRFTDWSKRPLTDKQITYALGDVLHLRDAYEMLHKELQKRNRENWVREEMEILTAPDTYRVDPDNAWQRMKSKITSPRFLAILKEVAAWREKEAQKRNVPRGWVMKDESILDIAARAPQNLKTLSRTRSLNKNFTEGKMAEELLKIIEKGRTIPVEKRKREQRIHAPEGVGAVTEMLKVLLKIQCENHEVAPKLIASVSDLQRIAAEDEPDVSALRGWRRKVFGEAALKLKNGEVALCLQDNRIALIDMQD